MSTGPIEFLSDDERDTRHTGYAPTEFGGVDGLIQPELDPLGTGGEAHSELTEEEKEGVVKRYGMTPLTMTEAWTGEVVDQAIRDPHTGRVVDPADLEDVTGVGGKPSDLKP